MLLPGWLRVCVCLAVATVTSNITVVADIYRWDTGEVIPGTEGIEPGPGAQLARWNWDGRNLGYADFSGGLDLSGSDFSRSNLGYADFSGASLTKARLDSAYMDGAIFAGATRSRHKEYLIKRIAWRMQANEEGGLSERALRRAMELANDADLRLTAPRKPKAAPDADERTRTVATAIRPGTDLLPGTVLRRDYKGRAVRVTVLDAGFEFEGERYKSLTGVAKAVTGKHWNGFHFFGLRNNGGER